jgi:hypothetical protein
MQIIYPARAYHDCFRITCSLKISPSRMNLPVRVVLFERVMSHRNLKNAATSNRMQNTSARGDFETRSLISINIASRYGSLI